ncbi:hypothetical protein EVJ58_g1359 [Rhodofomes roseus]|uniref:Uncharacterized protein n=1 Tax=Rhodofomes roseus TaxID=34475 RepID=A0A4Y9YZR4_9APHY|nr:hypothetical protein EVJ58_g1359 [Rhodofomes roseus]
MSRIQQDAIFRLSDDKETRALALNLLNTAALATGPGTGYDLREGLSGLPAICAYIASEHGDVAERVAQGASCLKPKVWRSTLKTVQAALEAVAAQKQEEEEAPLDYEDLIARRRLKESAFVAVCMHDVERALLKTGRLLEEFHPPNDVLKVSVFVWVCVSLLKIRSVTPESMLKNYEISKRDFNDIVEVLEESCAETAKKIRRRVLEFRAKVVAAKSSAVSATQPSEASDSRARTVSPSRSALVTDTGGEPSVLPDEVPIASSSKSVVIPDSARDASVPPHKTPTHKRKVAFAELDDADAELLDTPSKRPRVASPTKASRNLPASPAKPTPRPAASAVPAAPVVPAAPAAPAPPAPPVQPIPNPDAISPSKPSRPSGSLPPPLPALTMPKPSIFPSTKSASAQSPLDLLAQRGSSRSPWNSPRPQTRSQTHPTPKPAPVAGRRRPAAAAARRGWRRRRGPRRRLRG